MHLISYHTWKSPVQQQGLQPAVGRQVLSLWVNIPVNCIPKEKGPEGSASSLKVQTVNPQWDFPPLAEVELQDTRTEAEDQGLLPPSLRSSPFWHYLAPSVPASLMFSPFHAFSLSKNEDQRFLSLSIILPLSPPPISSQLTQCYISFLLIPTPKQMSLTQ